MKKENKEKRKTKDRHATHKRNRYFFSIEFLLMNWKASTGKLLLSLSYGENKEKKVEDAGKTSSFCFFFFRVKS